MLAGSVLWGLTPDGRSFGIGQAGAGSLPGPLPHPLVTRIQTLKSLIDHENHGAGDHINLLQISAEDLNTRFLQPMLEILNRHDFQTLKYQEQVDALWAYDIVRAYLVHWAAEARNAEGDQKLALINTPENQTIFANAYRGVFANINRRPRFNAGKNVYQKILQLHAHSHQIFDKGTPVGYLLNPEHIEHARTRVASERTTSGSVTERRINACFDRAVTGMAVSFEFIAGTFIEPLTGLELDYPSSGLQISLETDGDVGHMDTATGSHSPVHHYKAHALREQGWHRVAIAASTYQNDEHFQPIATNIIAALKEPAIMQAFAAQKALGETQQALRVLIAKFRAHDHTEEQVLPLVVLEQKIRALIQERRISNFLESIPRNSSRFQHLAALWQRQQINERQIHIVNQQIESAKREYNLDRNLQYIRQSISTTQLVEDIMKIYAAYLEPNAELIGVDVPRDQWLQQTVRAINANIEQRITLDPDRGLLVQRSVQAIWGFAQAQADNWAQKSMLEQERVANQTEINTYLNSDTIVADMTARMDTLKSEVQSQISESEVALRAVALRQQLLAHGSDDERSDDRRRRLRQQERERELARERDRDRRDRRDHRTSRSTRYDSSDSDRSRDRSESDWSRSDSDSDSDYESRRRHHHHSHRSHSHRSRHSSRSLHRHRSHHHHDSRSSSHRRYR